MCSLRFSVLNVFVCVCACVCAWLCCAYMVNCICMRTLQWWANIIKWTGTNIPIYSDATLCTKWISEYIQMPHIYQTNNWIYSYAGYSPNTIGMILEGNFIQICKYSFTHLIEEIFEKVSLMLPLNKMLF